jgi:hypothetical protein
MIAHVVGVDPGLVHTGLVELLMDTWKKECLARYEVVDGLDPHAVVAWVPAQATCFVEKYIPRQRMSSDSRMLEMDRDLSRMLLAPVMLGNTGAHRIVTQQLMEMLGLWKWPLRTHHQDLRAAARIALLGMMKSPELNPVLSVMVEDGLDKVPWTTRMEHRARA